MGTPLATSVPRVRMVAGDDVLLDQLAEDRHLDQEQVPSHPPALELAYQFQDQPDRQRDARQQIPVIDHAVRHVDQDLGHLGQVGVEVLENLLELGHDPQHDEDQDARRRR